MLLPSATDFYNMPFAYNWRCHNSDAFNHAPGLTVGMTFMQAQLCPALISL